MGKQTEHGHAREIWAVVLVGLALLLLLSLVSYDKYDVGDVAASGARPLKNFIGPVGAWIAYTTFKTLGLGAYVLMLVLATLGALLLLGHEIPWRGKVGAGVLLLVSAGALLHIWDLKGAQTRLNLPSSGGFIGMFIGDFSKGLVGTAGTVIVWSAAYLISLIVLVNLRPSHWVALAAGGAQDAWERMRGKPRGLTEVREELLEQERQLRLKEREVGRELSRKEREARKLEQEKTPQPEPTIVDRTQPLSALKPAAEAAKDKPKDEGKDKQQTPSLVQKVAERLNGKKEATPAAAGAVAAAKPKAEKPVAPPEPDQPYVIPPWDLLQLPPPVEARNTTVVEDLKLNGEILRQTLQDFDIDVQLAGITKGPVVTLYEVIPASGVRVEKISALSNNIALAMKAVAVRILTPVPGKGTVGIEVPNPKSTIVYLRDMLESDDYKNTKAKIPVALGRDVAGNPIIADLSDMPHLLVAGATGSGKTVCINAILASLLCRFTPQELRLLLVDPKVVEMQHYNVLPHLIVPVVTEAKKVPLALRYVINEMEKRFQILAKAGVRNITAFNARPKAPPKPKPAPVTAEKKENGVELEQETLKIEVPRDFELVIPEKLPYIVIIIDELADLMLVAPADVENAIARLAQLARAVGIHMILATQRPSVNVVTGVIKANFPARIAFQVASKQDSRVILDANGADKLLGKGDMLYLAPGAAKLVRAQGVLVQDDEIKHVVDFIAERSKTRFEPEIHQKLAKPNMMPGDMAEEEDEGLVEQAVEVIRQTNRASVSILQRRLRIGYTRAARIMDLLEERGIVGPNKGAEPRDILTDLDGGPGPDQNGE